VQHILHNKIPNAPGGGTVLFVTEGTLFDIRKQLVSTSMSPRVNLLTERHVYTDNVEEREEGGTPNIIGAVRYNIPLHG